MAEATLDIPLAELDIESNPLLSSYNEKPNEDASSFTNDNNELNLADTTTTAAPNDIESNRLTSNCNEEPNKGASSFTNDEVELNLVDTTTSADCKVESTSDISAGIQPTDSPGLFRT